jgi:hypothetical protein
LTNDFILFLNSSNENVFLLIKGVIEKELIMRSKNKNNFFIILFF